MTKKSPAKLATAAAVAAKALKEHAIVGREAEAQRLAQMLMAGRNVLIEGPVGVGKTVLAQALASALGRKVIRVDGDSRFTEQKLTGWFDPALALKKGFNAKTFIPGPLVEAMQGGSVLFINELNRMPEAVQNVLLPAIDEGLVQIPQMGLVKAKAGFMLVATQNPREFVATSHLSEALMDRMEWLPLSYQSAEEERAIAATASGFDQEPFLSLTVALVRLTRGHPRIKRGASVRAAIAIARLLAQALKDSVTGTLGENDFRAAVMAALPNRIELMSTELEGGLEQQMGLIVQELLDEVKKNS